MIDHITMLRAQEAGLPAAESQPDPSLACFPMRFEWEIAEGRLVEKCTQHNCSVCSGPPQTTARAPWPAPEVGSREVAEAHGKVSLLEAAEAFGWSYRITYAVGCWPSVGGRPSRQRPSYAYRLWRGDQRAVAVYVAPASADGGKTWSWDTLLTWDLASFPRGHANLEAFAAAICGPVQAVKWPGKGDWSCPYFGPLHGPEKLKRVRS